MDWQARYELGDTPWDKGEYAPSLDYLTNDYPELFSKEKYFLVPGCGAGHDALRLASNVGRVMGVDIAPTAIKFAAQKAVGVEDLEFDLVDLFEIPKSMLGCFDGVWEHTCYCAISPSLRPAYVESMWALLKPSGYLVGVFFINPDVAPGEGPPFAASVAEISEDFFPHFSLEVNVEPKAFYQGREQRERILIFRRKG